MNKIAINAINLTTCDSKKTINITCNYTRNLKSIDKKDCTRIYIGSRLSSSPVPNSVSYDFPLEHCYFSTIILTNIIEFFSTIITLIMLKIKIFDLNPH